ncbi:cyanophycinase [Marivirga sericea]|uniref:Cyanophycinase n=1 Tax=Marivirga sericea TaxID=1028 RepID=A0A1X7JQL7_9BACT|nr:cyanophycinase [Marivirga sericea]SMG30302.1 cyanophycinase [Marivirga sericea]
MRLNSYFRISLVVYLCLFSFGLQAQGNLMLVGGGGEIDGGWSDTPYQWMVDNAENKKIGIISYSDADNWLPDYFVSLGANEAVNIKIDSRDLANQSNMFDSLNQYDGLFFKGGDQSRYYEYYKDTEVQAAIEAIYSRGGVIGGTSAGMAILSGVMFTASNGSAYPYDALTDINSEFMKLQNDFLSFYPDYIFDTHFVERGRTPRLIGFLANWFDKNSQLIKGIGIDDRTAFCINTQSFGTVYGTGAASIYHPKDFQIQEGKITNSNVSAIQLTHAQSYDLNTSQVLERNLSEMSQPESSLPYYQVFATSESILSNTRNILQDAISSEKLGMKILLVSKPNNSKIADYKQFLAENTSSEIVLLELSADEEQDQQIALRNNIRESSLLIFLEPGNLIEYFNSGATGELLAAHITRNEITNVFLGSVANQLGENYANNIYQDPFNAYYGDIEFSDGLGLMKDFSIITASYGLDDKDYYENITSSVVDRVLRENLSYGIYLTGNTYLSYTLNENDRAILKIDGDLSSVLVENFGTKYAQTDQKVSGSSSRLQYAFDSLNYKIVRGIEFEIGDVAATEQEDYQFEEEEVLSSNELLDLGVKLLQNPVQSNLKLRNNSSKNYKIQVSTMEGSLVFDSILQNHSLREFYVGYLPSSQYIVVLSDVVNGKKYFIKMLKTN